MKFSIIIPFKGNGFNEKYLENCVDSLNQQTLSDFEVIFLHNNSADLVNLINDRGLKVNHVKMNDSDSLSDYRNSGINKARGEYVIFLDADDYLHPNALTYAQEMINENKGYCNVFKFGITKTNLDKTSTLNKSKRAFFEGDSFTKLESVLNNADIDVKQDTIKQIINGMFEKN
ncbi:glycosyltransferase family 2 protein [Staphylococcus shinii]|uniref:glycosyltransferase family 2 protein n=1 Tax=Staphylococcus shinii TaxID=2912228 RepID=UPI00298F0695|nr:glycosyltransferase family A protein [Staphylococcus shinii]MDW8564936.1 glycosyltransferase family A protein [Staphylococcus shinii]MDW8568176.1 glycosyltransferase family A protein [Staphylococcus shinii]MDW8570969.1 glycosyltransferase family A protein [Staphylococcus shinii]MDW8573127.1 glycosyltransferase family A protein [Staphylococcus shinii]